MLLSQQSKHTQSHAHPPPHTHTFLSSAIPYRLCLYSKVETTFSHLSDQLITPDGKVKRLTQTFSWAYCELLASCYKLCLFSIYSTFIKLGRRVHWASNAGKEILSSVQLQGNWGIGYVGLRQMGNARIVGKQKKDKTKARISKIRQNLEISTATTNLRIRENDTKWRVI